MARACSIIGNFGRIRFMPMPEMEPKRCRRGHQVAGANAFFNHGSMRCRACRKLMRCRLYWRRELALYWAHSKWTNGLKVPSAIEIAVPMLDTKVNGRAVPNLAGRDPDTTANQTPRKRSAPTS